MQRSSHVFLSVIALLTWACGSSDVMDDNCVVKGCPSGLACNVVTRQCVVSSGSRVDAATIDGAPGSADAPAPGPPDAGVPDADEPDAAAPDAAPSFDAPQDTPSPDAGLPDAPPDAAAPDAAVPDAPAPDAAPPDAAAPDAMWGPINLTVSDFGVPVSGATVFVHAPGGEVLRDQVSTNAQGKVSVIAEPGSWVTVAVEGSALELTTFVGVQSQDTLFVGDSTVEPPPAGGVTVNVPETRSDALESYRIELRARLDGFSCQFPLLFTSVAIPFSQLIEANFCGLEGTGYIIGMVEPPGSSDLGDEYAFSVLPFPVTAQGTTVDMTRLTWHDAATFTFDVSNATARFQDALVSVFGAQRTITDTPVTITVPSTIPTYTVRATGRFTSDTELASSQATRVRQLPPGETTFDVRQLSPVLTSITPSSTLGRYAVSWTASSSTNGKAGGIVDIRFSCKCAGGSWRMIVPPGTRSIRTPPVPSGFDPFFDDAPNAWTVEFFTAPGLGTFADFRERYHLRFDEPEYDVTSIDD